MRLNASGQSGTARPTFSVVTAAPHQTRITVHATMNAAKHRNGFEKSLVTGHWSLVIPGGAGRLDGGGEAQRKRNAGVSPNATKIWHESTM